MAVKRYAEYIQALVDGQKIPVLVGLRNIYINNKGNLNISTDTDEAGNKLENIPTSSKGKINIETKEGGDIQLKPGDDIALITSHKAQTEQGELKVRVLDGADKPVHLKVQASEITLMTDDYTNLGSSNQILDVNVRANTSAHAGTNHQDELAYLKLRARAIDLRCEEHGGIAIQPMGHDSHGLMNKIKFEHGGGDGLEYGTFNTEKASLFTDEYRFNKDGIVKMATRETIISDKWNEGQDETTHYKYLKQSDDFYDIINPNDAYTTWKHIIKTAHAFNTAPGMKTEITSNGHCKILAEDYYEVVQATDSVEPTSTVAIPIETGVFYSKNDLKDIPMPDDTTAYDFVGKNIRIVGSSNIYTIKAKLSPDINISSGHEVALEAKLGDVVLNSGDTIKAEAPEIRLNAVNADKTGGMVNFGATQKLMFLEKKFTKGGNVEAPELDTEIVLATQNNSWKIIYWDSTENKFIRTCDTLYYDEAKTQVYNPTAHTKDVPVYFEDGTLVPADTSCFVMGPTTNGINTIYKVETKGSSAVLSKSNKAVAEVNPDGSEYTRLYKDVSTGEVYNPDVIFKASTWTPTTQTAIEPLQFLPSQSCNLSDIVKFTKWAKEHNFGPWE